MHDPPPDTSTPFFVFTSFHSPLAQVPCQEIKIAIQPMFSPIENEEICLSRHVSSRLALAAESLKESVGVLLHQLLLGLDAMKIRAPLGGFLWSDIDLITKLHIPLNIWSDAGLNIPEVEWDGSYSCLVGPFTANWFNTNDPRKCVSHFWEMFDFDQCKMQLTKD